MDVNFQDLSTFHRELLTRLLAAEFFGKEQLTQQIHSGRFTVIDANQSLAIKASGPRAEVRKRVPVEANALDKDGMMIHSLLFVRGGYVYMLENFRGDGNPIQQMPSAAEFQVLVLGDAKKKV